MSVRQVGRTVFKGLVSTPGSAEADSSRMQVGFHSAGPRIVLVCRGRPLFFGKPIGKV